MTKKKDGQAKITRRQRPNHSFVVKEENQKLLDFLIHTALKDKSRTTVKQLLHDRFISVNNVATTQFDLELKVGDKVILHGMPVATELKHPLIEILWQDDDLLVFHKQAGIPTVSSGDEKDKTAMQVISEHLKKFNPRAKVFLLNRIDKDSAGLVVMAKSHKLQEEMTDNWQRYVKKQVFVLAIEGFMPQQNGILAAPKPKELTDKAKKKQRFAADRTKAGEGIYKVLQISETASLLTLSLTSGRNNRLRRQMKVQGTPIIGDWRSGSQFDKLGRVALDSKSIVLTHPKTGELLTFNRPVPGVFRQWLKSLPLSEK